MSLLLLYFLLLALVSAQKAGAISSEAWQPAATKQHAVLDECCTVHFAGGAVQLTEKNRVELVQKQL